MIELGKRQELTVVRIVDFGVYLGDAASKQTVLLPKKQVPEGIQLDDKINVFIYKDSEDRLIATTKEPLIETGKLAVLKVVEVVKIGAFLNWGLEKDLLLPYKEQTHRIKAGENCLVALYVDKTERLCATMKVYGYLSAASPYQKDDQVTGVVFEINQGQGAFVAVDQKYYGLIPRNELFGEVRCGDYVETRVSSVREDGKLMLSLRQKAYLQMDSDARKILQIIDEFEGELPFTDKASPEIIRREFHMSKNEFKRAVGRLLKEKKIEITENTIRKLF